MVHAPPARRCTNKGVVPTFIYYNINSRCLAHAALESNQAGFAFAAALGISEGIRSASGRASRNKLNLFRTAPLGHYLESGTHPTVPWTSEFGF
jgi:hypothetical protein